MKTCKILYLVFLFATLSACDKFLDKNPENQIAIDVLFSDMQGSKAALTGVYNALFSSNYYNGERMVYPDLVGGNLKHDSAKNNLVDVYNFHAEAQSSSMNKLYAEQYRILNNINNILTYVPKLQDGSIAERNELLAQAYGLRALLHLDLVQLYAQAYAYTADGSHLGIILALAPIRPADTQRRRSTVAEVYSSILQDLDQADSLFQVSQSIFSGNTVIYMNADAVNALRARIALQMEKWETAYHYSNQIINQRYQLYSNSTYRASWLRATTSESIFELAVPGSYAGNSLGHYYVDTAGNNYFQFLPSRDLLNLFSEGDVRADGGLSKYPTIGVNATSVKLVRLSELYLIRAEASAERGDLQSALTDLNTIRLRGNPNLAPFSATTKEHLIAEILAERRRELCLEGFLFFDLMRRGHAVDRTDCIGENCSLTYPSDKFALPIPQQSVSGNELMVQNPSY